MKIIIEGESKEINEVLSFIASSRNDLSNNQVLQSVEEYLRGKTNE